MAVRPIFLSPENQALFEKQGFLILPFLNEGEVMHMDKLFDELHQQLPEMGFFAGSYSPNLEYKRRVSEEIKKVFKRRYEEVFQNYETFGGAYLFKIPSVNSELYLHQDWTVVDETKDIALNVWVPLCDITPENGPLMILPGSQFSVYPTLRSPTLPQFFDKDPQYVMDELEMQIVKAGTAVILNQSLVHYSLPNRSDKIRKAITAGVKTKGAQMIFHYKDALRTDNQVEKFEMNDDFFILFENFFQDIFQRPKMGQSVGFIDYTVPVCEPDVLRKLVKEMKTNAGFSVKHQQETVSSPLSGQSTNQINDRQGLIQKIKRLFAKA
jgi:hypothetical protein